MFLSATLSNANEFSQWVAYLHKQPCHVVYTDYRPTPLEHYVCPIGGQGLYKVGGLLYSVGQHSRRACFAWFKGKCLSARTKAGLGNLSRCQLYLNKCSQACATLVLKPWSVMVWNPAKGRVLVLVHVIPTQHGRILSVLARGILELLEAVISH